MTWEKNGRSILKLEQVVDMKRRLRLGEKVSELAKEFSVSWTAIKYIANGRNWATVEV